LWCYGSALNLYSGFTSTGLGTGGAVNITGGGGFVSRAVNISTTASYGRPGSINL